MCHVVKRKEGSFTVEATFVATITIWTIFFLLYLAMFSHDQTVLYSMGQRILQENYNVERGKEMIEKQLLISKVNSLEYSKKGLRGKLMISVKINMTIPFFAFPREYRDEICGQRWKYSERMWDKEILKKE